MNTQELLQKSRSLFECKQFLLAKEHLQAMLDMNQNNIEALFLMAQCDEALGKTKAMASSLFKILSIDTNNVLALEKLRDFGFLGTGEKHDEIELVETVLENGSVYLLPIHDDKIEDGFGAAITHDGVFYAGMLKDGEMFGHGIMKGSTGIIYVGNFNGSNLEGEGTMITDNYQVKSTFLDGKPDRMTPFEIKWRNGNRAVVSIDNSNWEDTSNWNYIEYYTADGTTIQMDFGNGDSIDIETGAFFIWKDEGDFRGFHWGDSKMEILEEEKNNEPIEIDNLVLYPALVAGFACSVCFNFEKSRLSSGGFMFEEEYDDSQQYAIVYNKIASFFRKKYGSPTKTHNSLVWHVNLETNLTMLKWNAGVRKIIALYSPSLI